MKLLLLSIILFVNITSCVAVKKCLNYLRNGADVDYATNTVKFPDTESKSAYASKLATTYDGKGLDPFFRLCESFMNTVQKKGLPKLTDQNGNMQSMSKVFNDLKSRTGKLYDFEVPIIATFGVGFILALLLPIIGCCFCCCRCCGKCGGEMIQSKEDADAHCKCCIFSFILFIVAVFMLCGMLMMFVMNNNLKAEVKTAGETYGNALDEAWNFISTVNSQLKEITENKTDCLYHDLIVPDISRQGVKDQIGTPLKDKIMPNVIGALNSVKNATKNVAKMNSSLSKVSETLAFLRTTADKLKAELSKARSDLQELKTNCSSVPAVSSDCAAISTDDLKQEANFSTVPDVTNELGNIANILNQNFSGAVDEGFAVFNAIPDIAADKAEPTLKDVRKLAKDGKDKLLNSTKSITKQINNFIVEKPKYEKYKKDPIDDITYYDSLRFYGFVGLSCMIALIVVLLSLGLACGVCGYSRDRNPVQRTSGSHHGGNCVMASVVFMFLFAIVLFLATAVLFLGGEHLYIVCKELKNAEIIDKYLAGKIKINGTALNVGDILKNCRKNMATYKAIDGEKIFDFKDKLNITKLLNINDKLEKINFNLSDQNVLNSNTKKSLQDLKNSSVDNINFTKYTDEIAKKVVVVDLISLANNLTNIASSIRAVNSSLEDLAKSFERVADNLRMIENGTVADMKNSSATLKINVDDLKGTASNMSNVADDILKKLEDADSHIRNNVAPDVMDLIRSYTDRVIGWPKEFVNHVIKQVNENLAKCKPISNVYDGLVNVYVCTGVIGNLNGFCLAMGWCLFFFPFAIIFGVKTAKYFRRMNMLSGFDSDPYPGYEQHAVKIPLQELNSRQTSHGAGHTNPSKSKGAVAPVYP